MSTAPATDSGVGTCNHDASAPHAEPLQACSKADKGAHLVEYEEAVCDCQYNGQVAAAHTQRQTPSAI